MAFKTYKFQDIADLTLHLNGGLRACPVERGLPDLTNKTLIFTKPSAVTVTFSAPVDVEKGFLFSDVQTQLEANVPGLRVTQKQGRLILIEATPTNGVEITGGTACSLLGLGTGTLTSKVYSYPSSSATPPHYVNTFADGSIITLLVKE